MITLECAYDNGIQINRDREIMALIKNAGGSLNGTGCCLFGTYQRDLSADFDSLPEANKATLAADLKKAGCCIVEFQTK